MSGVDVSPNTVMAAARALASAAVTADQLALIDPRELLLPEGDARELVARSEGDGDAWREIAQRLSRAMVRGGWPDPLDPWPGPTG